MKTKSFLVLIFFSAISFAQTNLVNNGNLETWTNATTPDGWTVENNVSQNTSDAAEGNSSASFLINDNTLKPKILTHVPLTSGIQYAISFKFKYLSSNYSGRHPITLKIVHYGSGTSISRNYFASSNNWVTKSSSFTPSQTGNYDFSFSLATFDGQSFEVLIDDIRVYDPLSSSVPDVDVKNSIKIYPTITEGRIYFEQTELITNLNISVINISGKKFDIKLEDNSMDLSFLKSGVYFINCFSDTINFTRIIIKK